MLLEYIKEVLSASYERAKGGSEVIEIIIALLVFFIPKLLKKCESGEKQSQQPTRHVLLKKFMTDDSWRFVVVLITLFVFEVLFVAPYQVYSQLKVEIDKTKKNEISVQWQPPDISLEVSQFVFYTGGRFEREDTGPMYVGKPSYLNIQEVKSNGGIANITISSSSGNYSVEMQLFKNKFYVNADIPTQTKPIRIRAGESGPLPDGWDWNSDATTFEIVDDQDQAVFQIMYGKYNNTNSVWIKGAIQIGGQVLILAANNVNTVEPHGFFKPSETELVTIFEYPSNIRRGVKVTK